MPPDATQPDIWAILSSVGTFTAGLGTIALSVLAFFGVKQWRAQMTGTSKYELARQLGHLAVRFQDELRQARGAMTFYYESEDRPREENESRQLANVLDESFARRKRLKPVRETLQQMQAVGWEAEVILGSEVREHIEGFQRIISRLALSTHVYFESRLRSARGEETLQTDEERKIFQGAWKDVYGGGSGDELAAEAKVATEALLRYLQQYIK
jgi:hypothetical protein